MRAPDTRHDPVYTDELTLEVTYSPGKTLRAVITRDTNHRFRVRRERWSLSEAEHVPGGFWEQTERHYSIAATLGAAREIAKEKLSETSGNVES